jgi:membrane protein implicated in regulation of membrane protease activity
MDFAIFNFLEGISPWWWIAFGIALGAVEMATMSFFLIWPSLAALVMALILFVSPSMSGEMQVMLFAIIAIALTFIGRGLMDRFGDGGGAESVLNKRSEALVGRQARVLDFEAGEGAVEIDGMRWRAIWENGSKGAAHVTITGADGMTLLVQDVVD